MIPKQNTFVEVDDLNALEEVDFSIGDPRWVMRTQADLYSNRELAVVREYSTNAFDANRERAAAEGRNPDPIEVQLPSVMNPVFVIRDKGFGMSRQTMREVYTAFGVSTKRDSDMYNGMLGYGSKSAIAYSPQFTVTSVHEGYKTVAVVVRKSDWSIKMKVMAHYETNEPSGTEISVPVHNHSEFSTKAKDFYKFWREGTVVINGSAHEFLDLKHIAGSFYESHTDESYIVMGNVPYRIENARDLFRGSEIMPVEFIAYVDTGQVEFTPNREALKYTDETVAVLKSIVNDFANTIKAIAKDEIDNAPTAPAAYANWVKWVDKIGHTYLGNLTYGGHTLSRKFPISGVRYRFGQRNGTRRVIEWNISNTKGTMFILGMPSNSPSADQRRKAVAYADHIGVNTNEYVFTCEDTIDCPWIDTTEKNFVQWADLKAALPKVPKTSAATGPRKAVKGSFDTYLNGSVYSSEQEIPDDYKPEEWFMVSSYENKYFKIQSIRSVLPKGVVNNVVVVPDNRQAKFKRNYPDIGGFVEFARSLVVTDGASLLSDEAKIYYDLEYSDTRWVKRLGKSMSNVLDPRVRQIVDVIESSPDDSEYTRNITLSQYTSAWVNEYEPVAKNVKYISNAYPLLSSLTNYYGSAYTEEISKEIVLYMNAKYNSINEKDEVENE